MTAPDSAITATPWRGLRHPVVRDLAWAVFSEPMLLSDQLGEPGLGNGRFACTEARLHRLRALDLQPAPLLAHLRSPPPRLGLYFEALWHFFLDRDPAVRLLGHNIPVRNAGRTLGEFDVLYECLDSGRQVHLELAVKFYLGVPGTATWLGPGQRDRLAQKCEHLLHRQIELGGAAEARSVLAAHGISDPTALGRQIEVKGYLFQAAADRAPCALPPGHNPGNGIARWSSLQAFEADGRGSAWVLLEKERWLSPRSGAPGGEPGAALAARLQAAFRAGRGPQLAIRCDARGDELERMFIAPQDWPARTVANTQSSQR